MAEMVTRPADHAQVSGTVDRRKGPGIQGGNCIVIASVHQQEVPRSKLVHARLRGNRRQRTRQL